MKKLGPMILIAAGMTILPHKTLADIYTFDFQGTLNQIYNGQTINGLSISSGTFVDVSFSIDSAIFTRILTISGMMFVLAMKLAAPVVAVLILTQIGLGLMSKFAPQVNILATGFPLTIALGLFFFSITLIFWGYAATESFTKLFHFLANFTR